MKKIIVILILGLVTNVSVIGDPVEWDNTTDPYNFTQMNLTIMRPPTQPKLLFAGIVVIVGIIAMAFIWKDVSKSDEIKWPKREMQQ